MCVARTSTRVIAPLRTETTQISTHQHSHQDGRMRTHLQVRMIARITLHVHRYVSCLKQELLDNQLRPT
jgi:hypothetical protein